MSVPKLCLSWLKIKTGWKQQITGSQGCVDKLTCLLCLHPDIEKKAVLGESEGRLFGTEPNLKGNRNKTV